MTDVQTLSFVFLVVEGREQVSNSEEGVSESVESPGPPPVATVPVRAD